MSEVFDPENVVPTVILGDPDSPYVFKRDYDQLLELYREICERVSELPGGIDDLPEVSKLL